MVSYDVHISHAAASTRFAGFLTTLLRERYGLEVFFYSDESPGFAVVKEAMRRSKMFLFCFHETINPHGYLTMNELPEMDNVVVLVGRFSLEDDRGFDEDRVSVEFENQQDIPDNLDLRFRLNDGLARLRDGEFARWFYVGDEMNFVQEQLKKLFRCNRELILKSPRQGKRSLYFVCDDFIRTGGGWMALELETKYGFTWHYHGNLEEGSRPRWEEYDAIFVLGSKPILEGEGLTAVVKQELEEIIQYKEKVVVIDAYRKAFDQNWFKDSIPILRYATQNHFWHGIPYERPKTN